MGFSKVLPLWFRVDLGVMAKKRYSKLPRYSEQEPHYQMLFILKKPLGEILLLYRG